MKNAYNVLLDRGFVSQSTSKDLDNLLATPLKFYFGVDPTSDSLHLGNMVGIMAVMHLQRCGHTPVILVGGATGAIGDPSGKTVERPSLDRVEIENNAVAIKKLLQTILSRHMDFGCGNAPVFVDNYEWFSSINVLDFFRDVGKEFRVGSMLAKESVKTRLDSDEGMSFTELSYQTLQGYDFYRLLNDMNVTLQVGGSDQYGNITAGVEFVRRKCGKSVYGLSFPLITRSDGKKFGKTEEGAIWLSKEKLSPFKFYQHLYRMPDSDICTLLRLLTFVEIDKINELEAELANGNAEPNFAQALLAEKVTRIIHGDEGLEQALQATEAITPGVKYSFADLKSKISDIEKSYPNVHLKKNDVVGGTFEELAIASGLLSSKSEVRMRVKNNGALLNMEVVSNSKRMISNEDLIENKYLIISSGKKRSILVVLQDS